MKFKEVMNMEMEVDKKNSGYTGTVKWFNNTKGYGFIKHASGQDVFVHYSVIEDAGFKTLNEGEEVEYELDRRVKGLFASKVKRTQIIETDEILKAPDGLLKNQSTNI